MIRRLLPYTTLAVIAAACYAGWTLYSRYRDEQRFEQQTKEREAEIARRTAKAYGGDKLTILSFAAEPGEVGPGQRVLLCYAVNNATQVKIEPDVEPLKPSLSRCLEVFPTRTTTYTLTAADDKGHSAAASLTVRVR